MRRSTTPPAANSGGRGTRRLLFVSPHFPPDSSAGSHRARILVPHLLAHGWEPVVLTVQPEAIDGRLDEDLRALIPDHVRVVRAHATAPRRARTAGVGDLGLRALRGMYVEGRRLLESERFDAVLITTYPIYTAWLGPRFKAAAGVPFVLDLQDPWVGAWGRTVGPGGRPDLRSRLSRRVAVTLERTIVPHADALVAVSARTIEELVARVPAVAARPTLELPIGWEPDDFDRVANRAPAGWRSAGDALHVSYVGTLLPAGRAIVRALATAAVQHARSSSARLVLHFVGTSNQTRYDGPPLVADVTSPDAKTLIDEHPERVPYLDALAILRTSDVVLVLGTHEPHYTASKAYPALASGRPVLAVVHEDSHAAAVLRGAHGVSLVTFASDIAEAELTARVAAGLRDALALTASAPFERGNVLDQFRGVVLAGRLAALLDGVTSGRRQEAHA